jgi:hypothetical protein
VVSGLEGAHTIARLIFIIFPWCRQGSAAWLAILLFGIQKTEMLRQLHYKRFEDVMIVTLQRFCTCTTP